MTRFYLTKQLVINGLTTKALNVSQNVINKYNVFLLDVRLM